MVHTYTCCMYAFMTLHRIAVISLMYHLCIVCDQQTYMEVTKGHFHHNKFLAQHGT